MTSSRTFIPVLVVLLTICADHSTGKVQALSISSEVTMHPVKIELINVSYQYPETWYRKFISAVPRREYALHNINLLVSNQVLLLTGDSDSGKTTLLKTIQGELQPNHGSVVISAGIDGPSYMGDSPMHLPMPVYMELQPDRSSGRASMREMILSTASTYLDEVASHAVSDHFSRLLDVSETALGQRRDQLSASDNYKLEIILGCLKSTLNLLQKRKDTTFADRVIHLPAPILLLDEWLDRETSAVVQRVQSSLCRLAEAGAIVCVISHRPERWCLDRARQVRLRQGCLEPISDEGWPIAT